ncbi:MAG: extracellular solute-binding protein, partial [Anaerolineae bacterium]|nr:extracellular solute-binding protein [Anaerolineae bacterium]
MSKITRRQFLKRAAALTSGAALSATPTGSLITFGKTFQQVAPITILINDSPWFAGFEAIVKMYQQETGNKVNLSVLPFAGMLDKSRNAVQGKQSEFDILNLNEQWYMPFYANGWVAPIKKIDPDFKLDPEVIE